MVLHELGVAAHLRRGLYQTGAFAAAWGWSLAYYAAAHVLHGESPLASQLGLGIVAATRGNSSDRDGDDGYSSLASGLTLFFGLLASYAVACGLAAALLTRLRAAPRGAMNPSAGRRGAATASIVAFLPSPVFSAALGAYLARFTAGGRLGMVLRDVLATYVSTHKTQRVWCVLLSCRL